LIDEFIYQYHNIIYIGIYEVRMGKNTSVTLGNHFDEFISRKIESGRYGSASEIIRAGLRLLEDSEQKMEALRSMLKEGEESGYSEFQYEEFVAELDNDYGK
jgi:antitoxin ParD1/3/4